MNISLDQYINGLERSVRALPEVFARWDSLDVELCEAYSTQLAWMLDARLDVLNRAKDEGRLAELALRLADVSASLFSMLEQLESLMGISTTSFLESMSTMSVTLPIHVSASDVVRDAANDNCRLAIAA